MEIIATNISSIFVFHQNKHFPWSLSLGLEVPRGDRFRARRRPRDLLLSILFLRSRTRPFSFFLSRESSWKTIIGHPTRENNNKRRLDSLCKFFDDTSSQNDRSFSTVTFIRLKFHRPSKFLATRIITWATSSNDNNLFPLGQQKNWNHGSFLSARPMIIAERKRGGYFLFAGRKRFDVFDPRRNVAKRGLECTISRVETFYVEISDRGLFCTLLYLANRR